jgi:integrase
MVQSEAPFPVKNGVKAGDPRRQKTLEDVMESVRRSPNLREQKRRTMLSALRTVARCLGRTPGEISALPAPLQQEMGAANFVLAGISRRRWTNVRSLTLATLRVSGTRIMPSRWKRSEYSPAWSALRSECTGHRFLIGLSRFMNFCSSRGTEPHDVNDAVFSEYRRQLEEQSLIRNAGTVFNQTRRLWDRAGAAVPSWPPYRVNMPSHSLGYSLDWSTFPASLHEDVEAFLGNGGNQNIFSADYARSVRPATTLNRRKVLRQMATALAADGFPLEEITDLRALVQPDNAQTILAFFLNRAGGKPTECLYSHGCLLRTIARYWVKDVTHSKLDAVCRNIAREMKKEKGMKKRNRVRLHQFDSPFNEAALLRLPAELLRLARQQDTGGEASLSYATYALAIEILTVHPMRINNLVGLELERNVRLPKDLRYGRVLLWIDGEDVKNGVAIDRELPPSTSAMIQDYVKVFRSRITDTPSKWLFPNPSGERRNTVGFGAQISTVIKRHTGLDVNPHLFRGLAVKLIEKEDPNAMETARRLLGHRHIETTIRSYSEGKTSEAHKQYEGLIENKRAELGIRNRSRVVS